MHCVDNTTNQGILGLNDKLLKHGQEEVKPIELTSHVTSSLEYDRFFVFAPNVFSERKSVLSEVLRLLHVPLGAGERRIDLPVDIVVVFDATWT